MDYIERYLHVTYSVDWIYCFLDNLCYRKEEGEKAGDDSKDDTVKDGYQYILGAWPRSESDKVKKRILSLDMKYGDVVEIKKDGDVRLVLSCTEKRAKQDAHNRQRGLARLQKRMADGRLTKQNNNRTTTNISRWRAR